MGKLFEKTAKYLGLEGKGCLEPIGASFKISSIQESLGFSEISTYFLCCNLASYGILLMLNDLSEDLRALCQDSTPEP